MKYKISKVILSSGLGGKSPKQISTIRQHFQLIFDRFLGVVKKQKILTTQCKTANAKFKIRQGVDMGLKVTLRKEKIKEMIQFLKKSIASFHEKVRYSSNALFFGVRDHRTLRLERYNHSAPEYGLNISIHFDFVGSRIKYRRINPLNPKVTIPVETCLALLDHV